MKHGGGNIMVWASIAANGIRKRSFIHGTMNAESYKLYVNILMTEMVPAAPKLLGQ